MSETNTSEDHNANGHKIPERRSGSIPAGVLKGAALLVAGTLTAVVAREAVDRIHDKHVTDKLTSSEASTFEKNRSSGFSILSGVVVLHEGVQLRETPDLINERTKWKVFHFSGNEDGKVASGDERVVSNPLVLTDKKGHITWIGLHKNESDNKKWEDWMFVNASDVAKEYDWVDYGDLAGKKVDDSKSGTDAEWWIKVYGADGKIESQPHLTPATIDNRGNAIASGSGADVARTWTEPAGIAQHLFDAQQSVN